MLASRPGPKAAISAYVAPRLTVERYTDRLDPASSLTATFVGGTSGFHLRAWFLDLFGEITLARLPANTYKGVLYPRRVIATGALLLAVRIGQPYDWRPRPR